MVKYIPERGDVVWIEKGREIQKRRPALIISPKEYNEKSCLALCMPITSKVKNYPFEVLLNEELITGAILSDQIISFDWQARKVAFIGKCDQDIFNEVISKFKLLIE